MLKKTFGIIFFLLLFYQTYVLLSVVCLRFCYLLKEVKLFIILHIRNFSLPLLFAIANNKKLWIKKN
jgi:hypothetical protein